MKITKSKLAAEIACEYHVASNNSPWLLKSPVIKQSNYSEHVQELMAEGPRRLEANPGDVRFDQTFAVKISLVEALTTRKSSREFSKTPIAFSKLGQLIGLSNGFRKAVGNGSGNGRNAPSAGGLGSCEMYVLVLNVEHVEPGIYHYDALMHQLSLVKAGNFKDWIWRMLLLQGELAEAGVLIFLASNQARLRSKYGPRAYRLGLLDAGHVSQNIYLVAQGLDLAVTATGGFIDDELNTALGLDGVDDCVVLVLAVGERLDQIPCSARAEHGPVPTNF